MQTFDGGKMKVTDPRTGHIETFDAKAFQQGAERAAAIDAEIEADEAKAATTAASSAGPKLSVKGGKATISQSGLGYKGILFGGYRADFEALMGYFGAPETSQAAKDYEANKDKLVATWQAYGNLPVGATLPDGSEKPPPRWR